MLVRRFRLLVGFATLALGLAASFSACTSTVVVTACQDDEANCDGECVDLDSDPDHCGGCASQCSLGDSCVQGTCGTGECLPPDVDCSGACVDLNADHDNCGGCGIDCGALFCESGGCVSSCSIGLTPCDGACVNTQTDPDNCGNCAIECPGVCTQGECAAGCEFGVECNGFCVDVKSDPQNCGDCNIACGFDQQCLDGFCQGGECDGGLSECFGECVDIFSDPQNCGFCGNDCGPGAFCQNAGCSLPPCDENVCGICEVAFLPSATPFSVTGNTSTTSNFFVPPCTNTQANEVLHVFTAPADDFYTFNMVGTQFDSVLSLLDPGSCGVIDCNDDTIGLAAQIQTFIGTGETVFIVVDGFSDGLYQLNVTSGDQCAGGLTECDDQCVDINFDQNHCGGCFQPCGVNASCDFGFCESFCNDACGACSILDLPFGVPLTFQNSTSGLSDAMFPSCALGSSSEQVHRFFAPSAGSYTFSTSGSAFDTVLSLMDPASCGELACNNDFGGFQTSSATVVLGAGQEVLVSVDGNGGSGFYNLSISSGAPPVCPTSTLGTALPITVSGSTSGAGNGFVPACSSSNAPEHTFTFTAPISKLYNFDTIGSSFDTVLSVLGGTCSGASLGCDDDGAGFGTASLVSVFLNAGQTVTVIVDGFGGGSGSYVLHVQ